MTRINFYTLKMVKEDSTLYEVPVIKSPAEVYQAAKQLLALHEEPAPTNGGVTGTVIRG